MGRTGASRSGTSAAFLGAVAPFGRQVARETGDGRQVPAPLQAGGGPSRTGGDVAGRLLASLRTRFGQGGAAGLSIEGAAKALGLSVRTLQRRLAEAGVTYIALRDQVRFEESCRMMLSPEAQLTDIAYQVGFSQPGHFTRAFRSWTGIAPRQFRKRIRQPEGGTRPGSPSGTVVRAGGDEPGVLCSDADSARDGHEP